MPSSSTDVAIIGAGPYGLSIAAHLRGHGIEHRIFGSPMQVWRERMPIGMYLKSEGFASNLSAPRHRNSFTEYCAPRGIDSTATVSRENFVAYGMWFQQQLVPYLEDVEVTSLERARGGFEIELATGERLHARRVVVSTGVSHFPYIPRDLASLPAELLTHTSAHHDLSMFVGRDVTVIGGGQSALETAALLHEQGATVRVLVRKAELSWNATPVAGPRSLRTRLKYPKSGLGPGRRTWVYEHVPLIIHNFPATTRTRLVREELGPAGSYWLKDRVLDRFPVMLGSSVVEAAPEKDGLRLTVTQSNGGEVTIRTDHVIAGTGYRADLDRLTFIESELRAEMRRVEGAPALSWHFESSVPGLYFTGLAAANSFGPLLRFVHGTGFAAQSIATHLAWKAAGSRRPLAAQAASEAKLAQSSGQQVSRVP
jgi:cation diffusion facilitator CzcD-associated flavoprotein CzcO